MLIHQFRSVKNLLVNRCLLDLALGVKPHQELGGWAAHVMGRHPSYQNNNNNNFLK